VQGFKSIRELSDFELTNLNVLIGANGAGKSNFISLFRMLAEMVDRHLQLFVKTEGGPDALLFGGRRRTQGIDVKLHFDSNGYHFALVPAADQLVFLSEETLYGAENVVGWESRESGYTESKLATPPRYDSFIVHYLLPALQSWRVFQFDDTSALAAVRNSQPVRDNLQLKSDASNLAPFLRMLRAEHRDSYKEIVRTVQMVAPFFGDFVHRQYPGDRVDLEWQETDDPDTPRGPLQLSDGTLRFICLATLLLQPSALQPDTIVIDEPELGLHPYALVVLSSLLRQVSDTKQVIVSTQSVELVNQFAANDVIITERQDGASVFDRLDGDHLKNWLEEYTLGELWKMNVVGGRPAR
jgi:predicted ATPase